MLSHAPRSPTFSLNQIQLRCILLCYVIFTLSTVSHFIPPPTHTHTYTYAQYYIHSSLFATSFDSLALSKCICSCIIQPISYNTPKIVHIFPATFNFPREESLQVSRTYIFGSRTYELRRFYLTQMFPRRLKIYANAPLYRCRYTTG
jgi:hypothetical protein